MFRCKIFQKNHQSHGRNFQTPGSLTLTITVRHLLLKSREGDLWLCDCSSQQLQPKNQPTAVQVFEGHATCVNSTCKNFGSIRKFSAGIVYLPR